MLTDNELDKLTKLDDSNTSIPSKLSDFEYKKRKIGGIVKSLEKPVGDYNPQKTINSIQDYIANGDRILYSELTNIVYAMSSKERGTVATNLDSLLNYSNEQKNCDNNEANKIVVKLWDHFNLACYQVDNAKAVLEKSTDETKESIYNQLYEKFKGIEKEYITILGIFSSILLAFVGGMTFSTSVLQNMKDVGVYRLILVILLLGFILINTINILLRYIFKLNHVETVKIPIWTLNIIFGILLIADAFAWLFSAYNIPSYISQWIPWMNT